MADLDLLKFWDSEKKTLKTSPQLWEEVKNDIIARYGTPAQNYLSDWDFFIDFSRNYALDQVENGFGDPRTQEHAINLFNVKNALIINEYTNYCRSLDDIFFEHLKMFSFHSMYEEIITDMIYEFIVSNAQEAGVSV